MKKILAFFLAALMVMSFAACGQTQNDPTDAPTDNVTAAPTGDPTETEPVVPAGDINAFAIYFNATDGSMQSLSAYPNEDGTVHIEMMLEEVKRGDVAGSAMAAIAQAYEASGLKAVESTPEGIYEGDNASISVSYTNGDYIFADLYGEMPEAFTTGYAAMVTCFKELTADLPVYVAKPVEMGQIADSDRTALDSILENLELIGLADTYVLTGYEKDENFGYNLYLSSDEGVASGASFAAGNMANPYSMMIVTLEEGADAAAVAASFEKGIDWARGICVQPEKAYIATKDNQAVLVLGSEDFFDANVTAIEAAGFIAYKTLENPDMMEEPTTEE